MISGSLALLYFLLCFYGGRQGSGPNCQSVRRFAPPSGPPARPEAQPARPEAQPARPEACGLAGSDLQRLKAARFWAAAR